MVFGSRVEIQSSLALSPVQADNFWRLRYRHDDNVDKNWCKGNHVQTRRASMTRRRSTSFSGFDNANGRDMHLQKSCNGLTKGLGSSPNLLPAIKEAAGQHRANIHKKPPLRRHNTEPGSLADEYLRQRTLQSSRAIEDLAPWDRDLFVQLPPVPKPKIPVVMHDIKPRRKSKVGDVDVKVDPVKRKEDSDRKPSMIGKLPVGAKHNPWNPKSSCHRLSLS